MRYLERLYERLGVRYARLYVLVVVLLSAVGLAAFVLAGWPYVDAPAGEILGAIAVFEGCLCVTAIVAYTGFVRPALGPSDRWLMDGRPSDRAAEVWHTVVRFPLLLFPAYALLVCITSVPACVYHVVVVDAPPAEIPLLLVLLAAIGAYGALLAFFGCELWARPVLRDLAARAGADLDLRLARIPIARKLLGAVALTAGSSGYFLSFALSVGDGSQRDMAIGLAATAAVTLSTTLIAALLVTGSVSGPLSDLVSATRRLRDGDLQARVAQLSDDEFGLAASSFNEMAAELQLSRGRLVSAREEERRRLRRDLHDGLGPTLAGMSMRLEALRELIKHDPAAADKLVAELRADTGEAIADIRRLVYGLRPPQLDELGLVGALQERAARLSAQGTDGLRVAVQAPERLPALPAAVEVAAYRIVEEALANVIRHAHATSCRVSLAIDGAFVLEVRDDGAGIEGASSAGVGLCSMRERAAELGGTCTVQPAPDGGTVVRASLPLPESVG